MAAYENIAVPIRGHIPSCSPNQAPDRKSVRRTQSTRPGVAVGKDPSKIKVCPECRRLVESVTMRPLSRNQLGSGIRYVCPDCFKRVLALRKVVRDARGK